MNPFKSFQNRKILTYLFILFLAACNSESNNLGYQEDGTINIGIAWVPGEDLFIEGAELAVAEANESGGVIEQEIELVINDNESTAFEILSHVSSLTAGDNIKEYSREIARNFMHDQRQISAVIGHRFSFMAFSAATLYQQGRMLFLAPTATNDLLTDMNFDYVFRISPNNTTLGWQLARYSASKKFKRVIVLNERSDYGLELSIAFMQFAARYGIRTVAKQSFFTSMSESEFLDYAIEFKRLHKEQPIDAIFIFSGTNIFRKIVKEFFKRGLEDVPFIGAEGLDKESFWNNMKTFQEKVKKPLLIAVPTLFNPDNTASRNFVEKFKHKYEKIPDRLAAIAYDSINILLKAIQKAGSSEPSKIADELRYMSTCNGLTGSFAFYKNGDVVYKPYMMKLLTQKGFEYRSLDNKIIKPSDSIFSGAKCINFDQDNDGIVNKLDKCPDNKPEEIVKGVFLEGKFIGCPMDSDNDKIPDYRDLSPNDTPIMISKGVDDKGRPLDTDADGIADYQDESINDSAEEISAGVNAKGIPLDSDKDKVPDYRDSCPKYNPKEHGEDMTKDGCPLDKDKDGIPNFWDKCQNNSPEELIFGVSPDGCPIDTDKDGIPNYKDKCPETDAGVKVDKKGCIIMASMVFPSDASFSRGSNILSAQAKQNLLKFLKSFDISSIKKIVVIAHTDGRGSEKYNLRLSQKRAKAVADFLMSNGIAREYIDAKGMGESQPVESNDTEAGRAKNRRFELRVQTIVQK